MQTLKDSVNNLDVILELFVDIQEKAQEQLKESDNQELKNLVLKYEVIKDRLVNVELPNLYELAFRG
jgi:hypothetical protein